MESESDPSVRCRWRGLDPRQNGAEGFTRRYVVMKTVLHIFLLLLLSLAMCFTTSCKLDDSSINGTIQDPSQNPGDDDDEEPPPSLIVSSTQLTTFTGFSWVEIAVDWTNKLAYLGSRETGVCVHVVDFSDEQNPVIVATFGTAQTHVTLGNTCLGVRHFDNNRRLIISHEDGDDVEVWDLGADPKLLGFVRRANQATANPRRIAGVTHVSGDDYFIYTGAQNGVRKIAYNRSTHAISEPLTVTTGHYNNDAVLVNDEFLVSGGMANGNPIRGYDVTDFSQDFNIDMDNGGSSGFWSAAVNDAQDKVFMGGWVSGFLSYSPGVLSLMQRFDNPSNFRDATFVNIGGVDYLYGVTPTDREIHVFNVDNIAAPSRIGVSVIDASLPGELYGLAVESGTGRAITMTNKGYFLILNLAGIESTSDQFPTF